MTFTLSSTAVSREQKRRQGTNSMKGHQQKRHGSCPGGEKWMEIVQRYKTYLCSSITHMMRFCSNGNRMKSTKEGEWTTWSSLDIVPEDLDSQQSGQQCLILPHGSIELCSWILRTVTSTFYSHMSVPKYIWNWILALLDSLILHKTVPETHAPRSKIQILFKSCQKTMGRILYTTMKNK